MRVLAVDDHEVVRAGIVSLLSREPSIEVVGAASSGAECLNLVGTTHPEVVLLDQRLGDTSGAALCSELLATHPSLSVLMLTSFESDEVVRSCLAAGARGYLTKADASANLISAIHVVAKGGGYFTSGVVSRISAWARQKGRSQYSNALTPEEIATLGLVAKGLSNRELGRELLMSESSVKTRLETLMRKLGASRRLDAVAAGIERGVI